MGLLLVSTAAPATAPSKSRPSFELLHRLECRACPLHKAEKDLIHPKMVPTGAVNPIITIIGEAPGQTEDQLGEQFVGPSGDLIRALIPRQWRGKIRWTNTIRCHPEGNRDPEEIEIEACRPSLIRDIERTKPRAIFGLGSVPLGWADKPSGITLWRGRRFPIRVGNHTCWYYAMFHPAFMLRDRRQTRYGREVKSDYELAFELDLRRAFAEVEAGLPEPVVHTEQFARKDIVCVTGRRSGDLDYVLEFLDWAGSLESVGVDYETQNLRPYWPSSRILTKAVSTPNETLAFAFRHPEAGWTSAQIKILDQHWRKFLLSPARKIAHNAAFETEWSCVFYGHDLAHDVRWEDTLSGAYVLDERVGDKKPGALALEFICLEYFGINVKRLTSGLDKSRMQEEPLEKILPYNGIDAKYHLLAWQEQEVRLRHQGLWEVYQEKVAQVPSTVLSQIKGLPVDAEENARLSLEYEKKVRAAEKSVLALPEAAEFRRVAGHAFNPGSNQDAALLLRDVLKTREGQNGTGWSTREEVLKSVGHPICEAILAYRKATKLKSTYVDPFSPGSETLYPDGKLHTIFNTVFAETGRLSSESPNLQNIPVRSPEGRRARRQVHKKNGVVASFDMGQIDGRLIACASRDPVYCKALWEDYDVHMHWARLLADAHPAFVGGKKFINDKDVMKAFRNHVKSVWVFALFYGAALSTTASRFGVEDHVLRPLYDRFWQTFEGVHAWQSRLIQQYETLGYVQLDNGLRRHAPLGRGQIINTGIQGATNRVVMDAMNRLSAARDWLLQPNLQIHDDLTYVFDCEDDLDEAAPRIIDAMLGVRFPWIVVPLSVELKVGDNWADMQEVGVYNSYKRLGWPQRAPEFC